MTPFFRKGTGERNVLAAEMSAGWWRDKIVNYAGKKSAFRAVLEVEYSSGAIKIYGTDTENWKAGTSGPVTRAGIYDGEEYDARKALPAAGNLAFAPAVKNGEFTGEILPSEGGEICRRFDLELKPSSAYVWKDVDGADAANGVFGRVRKLRDVSFDGKTPVSLADGETLVVDFGQNCAAVPVFMFSAAEGTVLTCLPGEMLNDANGERSRGNDGPGGSIYRENLRIPESGMRIRYIFGPTGGFVSYMPRHTFFGYRYVSIAATGDVSLLSVKSVPVTSIKKGMELGSLETGIPELNRLVANIYWGQLSNYLSIPTDCPQRNERLGWTADTQVFAEAGAFNADTRSFLVKWMRDMRDSQDPMGGFPGVAPRGQFGDESMRLGWSDAGVIVPYIVWKQFGDRSIVDDNWNAMERLMARAAETEYKTVNLPECRSYQWNDWLSLAKLESCPYKPELSAFERGPDGKRRTKPDALEYWNYMGGCYWLMDARVCTRMLD